MSLTEDDRRWILDQLAGVEERLTERMRDMQIELLKGYLPAQQQARDRNAALEARAAAMESRQNTLEGRLAEIEKKLLMNGGSHP